MQVLTQSAHPDIDSEGNLWNNAMVMDFSGKVPGMVLLVYKVPGMLDQTSKAKKLFDKIEWTAPVKVRGNAQCAKI